MLLSRFIILLRVNEPESDVVRAKITKENPE